MRASFIRERNYQNIYKEVIQDIKEYNRKKESQLNNE
jgi:hypothetical protein